VILVVLRLIVILLYSVMQWKFLTTVWWKIRNRHHTNEVSPIRDISYRNTPDVPVVDGLVTNGNVPAVDGLVTKGNAPAVDDLVANGNAPDEIERFPVDDDEASEVDTSIVLS